MSELKMQSNFQKSIQEPICWRFSQLSTRNAFKIWKLNFLKTFTPLHPKTKKCDQKLKIKFYGDFHDQRPKNVTEILKLTTFNQKICSKFENRNLLKIFKTIEQKIQSKFEIKFVEDFHDIRHKIAIYILFYFFWKFSQLFWMWYRFKNSGPSTQNCIPNFILIF